MKLDPLNHDAAAVRLRSERKDAIDAAIVKVMKRGRHLHLDLLLREVRTLAAGRFGGVQAKELCERIENIAARGYIKRDRRNADLFHYLP